MFSTQLTTEMDAGHDDGLAAEHDVLLAFDECSSRYLVSSVLFIVQILKMPLQKDQVWNYTLTVSMYSVFVERLLAGPEARAMTR